jgi:N-acetylmuramoyl-L-alanine amidase
LAKSLHTTAKAIENANPGVNPAKLRVGQKIHLPVASAAPAEATAATTANSSADEHTYTVKRGDYLLKIAKQFGIKASAIREANSLKKDQIAVGQKLKIPGKASAATPGPTA